MESSGVPQSAIGGELRVYVPENAVPKRHVFVDKDASEPDMELQHITVQVLQVYRSNISLIQPAPTAEGNALSLNVSETASIPALLGKPRQWRGYLCV